MDSEDEPFVVSGMLLCLVEGDVEGLEWLIDFAVPRAKFGHQFQWIIDKSKEVLREWEEIEAAHGRGAMLNLEAIDMYPSFPDCGREKRATAARYRDAVGLSVYRQRLQFQFDA